MEAAADRRIIIAPCRNELEEIHQRTVLVGSLDCSSGGVWRQARGDSQAVKAWQRALAYAILSYIA